jgi:hypothetical protein
VGPIDTLLIEDDLVQEGNIVVFGHGVLIVDGATLTLAGQLWIQDHGHAIVRSGGYLHFDQSYVGQYSIWMIGDARFDASDATIDANGSLHFAELWENASYTAVRTDFPDWTYRRIHDHAALILEDVDHVGDILVNDSCHIHLTRCDTLMPWLETPDGSVVDFQFPDPDFVEHFEFSDDVPGIDGIGYSFVGDSCRHCWWSLETWPGCDVTIRGSVIRGSCMRIPGSDTVTISEIDNYGFYPDFVVPLDDRHVEYVDTYVFWWNWYPLENTTFYIDTCRFGELIGKGNSVTYATHCLHDGATICLSVKDSAFVSFADGNSWAYVTSLDRGTMLLVNSTVTPLWPYQSENYALNNSRLLAVNCSFEHEPQALDSALVMFAVIDSLPEVAIDSLTDVTGSAWIDAGLWNPAEFERCALHWAFAGDSLWTLIGESTVEISHDILASWDTFGMVPAAYELRLTVLDTPGDSLVAYRDVTLVEQGGGAVPEPGTDLTRRGTLWIQPNPFRAETIISCGLSAREPATLRIYDATGHLVRVVKDLPGRKGLWSVTWDGRDARGRLLPPGIFFCHLQTRGGLTESRKLVLCR